MQTLSGKITPRMSYVELLVESETNNRLSVKNFYHQKNRKAY